ncbi:DNA polymerase III subunit gamma/tau [Collinsella sp. zg1085]|uniref:DNA polymerase III subunit gamma/tau n=1 Tax=Collinsella sp. zg1085 TaxID=2844380 RepID=UPI001C0C699B|nr:DNA polymerase III subunit gamma/tau [Collinsella sp. zg1085]QWT17777.1 DNA polymerase III subunit gamma/tau [Collinsella sp. zg1085]
MESLYRRYRPLSFDSVVGQEHIVSTLEHAVTENRLSHAYLFCGPRGTGKTTMARILAKALLCKKSAETPEGMGCIPDGTCHECEEIAAGIHPDVYELDAASRTGVDNVREEIVNSVSFAPVRGAYKVYIIDEVHMLTTAAFNALLKTLEEPPAHVVFILCTTDPQKILETILSRCQRFDFHRIGTNDLIQRMRFVCEHEGFQANDEALELVAHHARGGMRDALSTLEQLSVFGAGEIRLADAQALLGATSASVLGLLSQALAARDVAGLYSLVREQTKSGADLVVLTRDLLAHLRDVYSVLVADTQIEDLHTDESSYAAMKAEAAAFESPDRLARILVALDHAALEMRDATDVRLVLELTLTRLARPESELTLEALAERIARLEAQLERVSAGNVVHEQTLAQTRGRAAAQCAPKNAMPIQNMQPTVEQAAGMSVETPAVAAEKPVKQTQHTAAPVAEPIPTAVPAAPMSTTAPAVTLGTSAQRATASKNTEQDNRPYTAGAPDAQARWREVVQQTTAAQASRGALLQHAQLSSDDGDQLVVTLPAGSNFALTMLGRPDSQALIQPIVQRIFGTRQVSYVMAGQAQADTTISEAPPAQAAATISENHPVQAVNSAPVQAATPAPTAAPSPAATAAKASHPVSVPSATTATTPSTTTAAAPASKPAAAAHPAKAPTLTPQPPAHTTKYDEELPPWENPQADTSTGPTLVSEPHVEADRAAWEDEYVPYDDADVAVFDENVDETPSAQSSSLPVADSPVNTHEHVGSNIEAPQSTDDAKALIGDIFGAGVVFKED